MNAVTRVATLMVFLLHSYWMAVARHEPQGNINFKDSGMIMTAGDLKGVSLLHRII
jgi:hypothetical protein